MPLANARIASWGRAGLSWRLPHLRNLRNLRETTGTSAIAFRESAYRVCSQGLPARLSTWAIGSLVTQSSVKDAAHGSPLFHGVRPLLNDSGARFGLENGRSNCETTRCDEHPHRCLARTTINLQSLREFAGSVLRIVQRFRRADRFRRRRSGRQTQSALETSASLKTQVTASPGERMSL